MLLEVRQLRTQYFNRDHVVTAVDGVDLDLADGDTLGIVGESGSGKTTLGYSLMGFLPPQGRVVSGTVTYQGATYTTLPACLRWNEIAMVFQGSMNALNPLFRVGNQIEEVLKIHTVLPKQQRQRRIVELLEMVELDPEYEHAFPHELSGGMRQRALIAMALACNPRILIADEPTSNLDVVTQKRIMTMFRTLKKKLDLSIILISHDLALISHFCDRVAVMESGKVVESGSVAAVFGNPQHPYTRRLIAAVLRINQHDE